MAKPKKKVTGKKSGLSLVREPSRTEKIAKDAREKASGKETGIYAKPKKPTKGSESYEYGDKKVRNTKFYSSSSDAALGEKTKTLKALGKAKEKNLTDKEARMMYEANDPKQKGKDFSQTTYSKVSSEAYDRAIARAQKSGLSSKDAKKAIDSAIRTISGNLQTDRSRTASRAEGIAKRELKKKQDKITRGY